MNTSKKLDFISQSSLVSLRAELARKQEEVLAAKSRSQAQYIRPIPHPKKETILTRKNVGIEQRELRDVEEEKEDKDAHEKSRISLENKAKLYDKLSQNSSLVDEECSSRYLVDFQHKDIIKPSTTIKPVEMGENVVPDGDSPLDSDDYDEPSDPEEDWVDYTDCLGRTRRCLRRDLPFIKEKDITFSKSLGYFEDKQPASSSPVATEIQGTSELMSTDMRKELMRQKWEQQEQELKDKSNVHYQDVLFDEARSHGVGYYGFSADEQQRQMQQEALSKLRNETQKQQESVRSMKDRRQQQMKQRLKAARQRKRARMGLPPEDEDSEPEDKVEPLEVGGKAAEKELNMEEEMVAKEKAKKKQFVRPWDIGKEGVTASESEVMSQEDWVKKRRSDRLQEFAPPPSYQEDVAGSQRKKRKVKPVFTQIRDEVSHETNMGSKDRSSSSSAREGPSGLHLQREEVRGRGVEIEPPPTFEYCGPSSAAAAMSKTQAKKAQSPADLDNAISAGLKFLRHQFEEKQRKQKEKGLLDII